MTLDRRSFVIGASGAAAAARLTVPAAARARKGSIDDIEHVVILMQENRSFDHYFGMLRGVRGFGDPRPAVLPGGKPVWAQPDGKDAVWPFRLDTRTTAAGCTASLDHSWKGSQQQWRNWDAWIAGKTPMTMGYLTREDLPYYYALADAFTVCDAYHCSIFGPTSPNRLYHFSGTSGLSAGFNGPYVVTNGGADTNPTADMAKDDPDIPGLPWIPYAERLERAGVSWRVYQEYDNFTDNPLAFFAAFRKLDPTSSRYRRARAWAPGSTAADAHTSKARHLIAEFAADVAADRLPAVSWIVAPEHMCEHPDAPPAYGQVLTAGLIAALAAHPEVWAKTVFILNFDENDGFFDHVPPPIPAIRPELGASTVSLRGEDYRGEPIGLGPRVPMVIASPWTRGGWVDSQLFDHTSVLRFLARRFGVEEPNISPWRREICGDLTSAFDFDRSLGQRRDTSWAKELPAVAGYIAKSDAECRLPAPTVVRTDAAPAPELGTRPARALPYDLDVVPRWSGGELTLAFVNRGSVGAVFQVQDRAAMDGYRYYTVGAGKTVSDSWRTADLVVSGPNGFHRAFRNPGSDRITAQARFDALRAMIALSNAGEGDKKLSVHSAHTGETRHLALSAGESGRVALGLAADHRWYDLEIRNAAGEVLARLAGHVETGEPGISEPIRAA
jgi:phospholipase C